MGEDWQSFTLLTSAPDGSELHIPAILLIKKEPMVPTGEVSQLVRTLGLPVIES
jgi:hypothetical protein